MIRARRSCSIAAVAGLRVTLAAVALACHGLWQTALANDLSQFLGTYVGQAIVDDLTTGEQRQRDIDIVVMPHRKDGLRIDWTTVGLVDGRRDVPGVERWSQTALFEPAADNDFMVEASKNDLFRERQATVPVAGDPVRWTRIDGNVLHTCSFVVLEDGRYELQLYQRILTEIGMDIHFERIVDGKLVRRVTGRTARAG